MDGATCTLCMNDVDVNMHHVVSPCLHKFCMDCWTEYISDWNRTKPRIVSCPRHAHDGIDRRRQLLTRLDDDDFYDVANSACVFNCGFTTEDAGSLYRISNCFCFLHECCWAINVTNLMRTKNLPIICPNCRAASDGIIVSQSFGVIQCSGCCKNCVERDNLSLFWCGWCPFTLASIR